MIGSISKYVVNIFKNRKILLILAKKDLLDESSGYIIGVFWKFLLPVIYVSAIVFIFSLGIRPLQDTGIEFTVYLAIGVCCWLMISDNLQQMVVAIKKNAYLAKSIDFNISYLPLIKFISNLPVQIFLVFCVIAYAAFSGYAPGWHTLSLLYYLFAAAVMLTTIGVFTATVFIFMKDIQKIVVIVVQLGFWLTPIIWHVDMLPDAWQFFVEYNPAYYIIAGYRESITNVGIFDDSNKMHVIFWCVQIALLFITTIAYKRLRSHVAEVL